MAAMEGSRPVLVELQALVTPSHLQVPRRLATGLETARLLQVLAVLERRCSRSFGSSDVYVSVAGGVRVGEPAVDLPLALALVSALEDRAVRTDALSFGEVGLTGRVRSVAHDEARLREAARQGFAVAIASVGSTGSVEGIAVSQASTLADALEQGLA
jgi:DNA repair protein RadA/Sms